MKGLDPFRLACGHRRGRLASAVAPGERLMRSGEVVVDEVQQHGSGQVLHLTTDGHNAYLNAVEDRLGVSGAGSCSATVAAWRA